MNQMKKEELEITISDSDRIECAIRHIQTAVDVDLWARKIAVDAMEKQIESVEPEIVRCKDCIHWHRKNDLPYCDRIDYGYGYEPDDFCSRAERRNDEQD